MAAITELEGHQRAQDAFAAVLANVKADQLDDPTTCTDWTVRDLIGHVVGGNQRTAGITAEAPGDPGSAVEAHAASARAAHAVFAAPDGLTRTFDVPFGSIPGAVFVRLRTIDAFVHAWDLARATAQPSDLDPDLAAEMLELSRRQLMQPELRGPGRPFAAEQPCDEGRPAADRLAAFLGRSV